MVFLVRSQHQSKQEPVPQTKPEGFPLWACRSDAPLCSIKVIIHPGLFARSWHVAYRRSQILERYINEYYIK